MNLELLLLTAGLKNSSVCYNGLLWFWELLVKRAITLSFGELDHFGKKSEELSAESKEVIVSGLIRRGAFKLWHVAWAIHIFVPSKFSRRGMESMTPCGVFGIIDRFQLQCHALPLHILLI
jgi:hypothetical protein